MRCEHQVPPVVFIRPTQNNTIGAGDAGDAADEAARQLVEYRRVGDEAGDFVQTFEPLFLFFELAGFFGDLLLEVAIHRLQVFRHFIEAGGEQAELVAADVLDAHVEIALLDFFDRLRQLADRFKDDHVAGVDEQGRNQYRHA